MTADAGGLCLKAGNAVILRGGSEALHSNRAIAASLRAGLTEAALPADAIQVVETTDRRAVGELLRLDEFVDIIVPRGGKGLIERVMAESRIPIIKHLDGICHVFIDERADPDKAIRVAYNAKTQRYGTCCTMETLLVDRAIAPEVLPPLAARYLEAGVELRGCPATRRLVDGCAEATPEDWDTEYLAPILSIRVVDGLDEAIDHIGTHGSAHTDAIVTEDYSRAQRFPPRSGLELRDGQRFDPFRGRLRVRARGGDRDQHRQAARARPGRAGGTHIAEVHRSRRRPYPAVRNGRPRLHGTPGARPPRREAPGRDLLHADRGSRPDPAGARAAGRGGAGRGPDVTRSASATAPLTVPERSSIRSAAACRRRHGG